MTTTPISDDALAEIRGRRERYRRVSAQDVTAWSDDDLLALLHESYDEPTIPPCRVCGGVLSMQACGGGRPTVWGCSGTDDEGRYVTGRSCADEHYGASRFEDRLSGGDERVVELIRRRDSLIARLRAAEAERDALRVVAAEAAAFCAEWRSNIRMLARVKVHAEKLFAALDACPKAGGGE